MNSEQWNLWKRPRELMSESMLMHYGVAVVLPMIAAYVVHARGAFTDVPFFLFLGAIVLSAAQGGLGPAFLATGLSLLFMRVLFVAPLGSLNYSNTSEGLERLGGFVLLALLASSFVADLRRERNHLRDSEERYRVLAETASDAIIVIDEHGEILYVNPVGERTFGARADQLRGQKLDLLLPGNRYQAQISELHHRLDTRQKPVAVQLPARHQSGEHLLVEMTLGSASHRGKSIFTAIIRDITAQAR
jgi:PAS domain S-box-containing protein